MELERLEISLRPRTPWEAVDLGLRLYQRHWRAALLPWLTLALPPLAALHLLFPEQGWLGTLFLWWCKPLWDRVFLLVFSRALFGDEPAARTALRSLRQALSSGLLLQLTLYRFDPGRSFKLPVYQLERLRGATRRRRIAVLARHGGGTATLLTLICLHLEWVVTLGLYGLLLLMLPEHLAERFLDALLSDSSAPWMEFLGNLVYLATLAVIEPLYVACGFMLYINRRSELEGWDLEIGLRRLARRLAAGVPAVALILLALAPPGPAHAEAPTTDDPEMVMQEVLADPIFGGMEERRLWLPDLERLFSERKRPKQAENALPLDLETLMRLLKYLAAGTLLGLLAWLLWRHRTEWRRPSPRAPDAPPAEIAGLDIRPQSLPDDIETAVRARWQAGDQRAALALLYRATLSHLVHRQGVPVHEGDSEREILARARGLLAPDRYPALETLTRDWERVAWAHRRLAENRLDPLLSAWQHLTARPPDGGAMPDSPEAAS